MRILLVEDDEMLGASLKKGLEFNGYSVEWVKTGSDALLANNTSDFDMGIFDVNLPSMSGIEVVSAIRRRESKKKMLILMLTVNDATAKKIAGLDAGADDYMTKPFDLNELMARLRALRRRYEGHSDNILRARDIEMNMVTNSVTILQSGESYQPSGNELKLLQLLMQRPGKMFSKEKIEEEIYGWNGEIGSNTVEVLIYNLRRKIGKETIISMRGVGYMVAA